MKILLTGASGLLGTAFAQAAKRRGHHVVGIIGQYEGPLEGLAEKKRLDLSDLVKLEALILEQFPDAIVNCAAISEPRSCERDPSSSRLINVALPEKLALLARHLFATFIHISSEQVFDGTAELYYRDSPPSPPNEYARQKLESEHRVNELAAEFTSTLRLPLLMGNSLTGTRSLHERLLLSWSEGRPTPLFTDEYRQPCLVENAAAAMVELCERPDLKGVYHWAGEKSLSRFEMGQRIAKHFGLPAEQLVVAAERGDNPRFANRQARLVFDLTPLASKLKTQPQAFSDQLDALIVPKPVRSWFNALP
ncbi:SDR family oxidoreductase [Pelagicoccus sp. SDUM812002]|uniref:SDR family oxidoreductase n=1 Tax=Pelagicoccus sp. SDUM812002 TaxID=3041266 RepID=UPI00280C9794|nr:SDR family oxidoreductase [Pelagicoccus sp. SDUM812002]MDQ8184904.1 SDR family oxidoreductase [Pelagicoccus sp. SDUM812002]